MTAERVRVGLGDRAYDIVVGRDVLASAGREISALTKSRRAFVVTDENVARRHLDALRHALRESGIECAVAILPPGEATKSFAMLEHVTGLMLDANIERGDMVVAIGGGVIGDLSGFAAGVLRRGVDYVQIPTTLLAQVDSSVGGKTAIDTPQGKNLIGLFHQPRLVLSDTGVLDSLPSREIRAGFAEVLKYGLIEDAAFAEWVAMHTQAILTKPGAERRDAIVNACKMKARVVEADEREAGRRTLLNLGHTFAHGIEAAAGYSGRVLHGEAVAVGCGLAFELSERLGLCESGTAAQVRDWYAAAGLPARISDLPDLGATADEFMTMMAQDKKTRGGRIVFVLARGIGKAFVATDVEPQIVERMLGEALAEEQSTQTKA
ncbi:MAG: 3-dehydroquinate synthase [Alphaproteobacteria bacterium]|nr:3-dehydroquinate synthase [Alphaproteobacteria bacterium]